MTLQDYLFRRHVEDEEAIRRIVHRHWLVGIKTVIWPAITLILAWTLVVMTMIRPMFTAALLWSIPGSIWLLRNFLDYYLDVWIITNKGVIDLAWFGWFHRQSTRVLYSDIQGVSYEIQGIAGTLLQFGTISIEKVSTGSSISLAHVSSPKDVEGLILENMEAYMHKKNMKNAKHVQELLSTLIANQIHTSTPVVPDAPADIVEKKPTKKSSPKKRSIRLKKTHE